MTDAKYPCDYEDEVSAILNSGEWQHTWHYPVRNAGLTNPRNARYAHKIIEQKLEAAEAFARRCRRVLVADWQYAMESDND